MDSSDDSKESFMKHVFYFNDKSKSDLLNMVQYSFIGVLPIIIINKLISKYIPEADDSKGSLEISAEVIIQILVMFFGLYMINRFITYFPTYSGENYIDYNITTTILSILMITLSLQTRLGEKVNILYERVTELWEGKSTSKKNPKVKVTQPISGQLLPSSQTSNQNAMNQSLYTDSTSISALPTNTQMPNYNNMYQKDNTPLVGAATPNMEGYENEIQPANSVLGGSFGSSW
jgi:hypothetical protein